MSELVDLYYLWNHCSISKNIMFSWSEGETKVFCSVVWSLNPWTCARYAEWFKWISEFTDPWSYNSSGIYW